MSRFNIVTLVALFLSLLRLTGCQHLVVDTDKLIKSNVDLPEIVGLLAGLGAIFAKSQASLKRGHESTVGAVMGAIQILVGVLRSANCFTTRDHLECYCCIHELPRRIWGIVISCAKNDPHLLSPPNRNQNCKGVLQ